MYFTNLHHSMTWTLTEMSCGNRKWLFCAQMSACVLLPPGHVCTLRLLLSTAPMYGVYRSIKIAHCPLRKLFKWPSLLTAAAIVLDKWIRKCRSVLFTSRVTTALPEVPRPNSIESAFQYFGQKRVKPGLNYHKPNLNMERIRKNIKPGLHRSKTELHQD